MGLTVLELKVANPAAPEATEKVEFLIDSGAVYSVVPTQILQKLGISALAEETFRLADGSKIVRKKGVALFKHGDRTGGSDVVFGQEGDSTLLGALTLEALGTLPRSVATGVKAPAHDPCNPCPRQAGRG